MIFGILWHGLVSHQVCINSAIEIVLYSHFSIHCALFLKIFFFLPISWTQIKSFAIFFFFPFNFLLQAIRNRKICFLLLFSNFVVFMKRSFFCPQEQKSWVYLSLCQDMKFAPFLECSLIRPGPPKVTAGCDHYFAHVVRPSVCLSVRTYFVPTL